MTCHFDDMGLDDVTLSLSTNDLSNKDFSDVLASIYLSVGVGVRFILLSI